MNNPPKKILVIQTAFLGDVILATSLIESLHRQFPEASVHFLVRKGNESLLKQHPYLSRLWILDKKNKYRNLLKTIRAVRTEQFDLVINLQRFLTSGLLAAFSGGKEIRGFRKNPASMAFTKSFPHDIHIHGSQHEIERNHSLISDLVPGPPLPPRLYPTIENQEELNVFSIKMPYICLAPASVWFTKQWPAVKWIEFLESISEELHVYLLGAPGDSGLAEEISAHVSNRHLSLINLTGKISLLASALLMKKARMNFVNDSAPLHLASAVNAPVTAVFCSTVPGFGFTPLSENAQIAETEVPLTCRPCGLHGHAACPEGHFKCALTISTDKLLTRL
jgi:heptosyltransferase-2